jgi:integrase
MAVFNRIYCSHCKKPHNVYDENLKELACSCGQSVKIPKQGNFFIEYYAEGRRRREKVGASRTLAETVYQKRKVEIAEGKFLDKRKDEKIKFEVFAEEYLELHSKVNNKSWRKSDQCNVNLLNKFFSGRFLNEITPRLVEEFKAQKLNEVINGKVRHTMSPARVNRLLSCLKCIFNKAHAWGRYSGENPVRKVKMLKENNTRMRFLEQEEIISLLSKCGDDLRPIVVVALNTGMRLGEILGLRWKDVDFQRGIIFLHDTKNGEKREVPMNENVRSALTAIPKYKTSEFVFCHKDGSPCRDIRSSFFTAMKNSGIKDFRFHDLRHTFASHLVMSGVDLNTVRELLGHKTLQMTLRYSHLSPNHKKRAVDILNKRIDTFWTPSTVQKSSADKAELVSV